MTRYLLSLYQPDGPPPPDLDLDAVMKDVDSLIEETKSAGVWVFNGGLHAPETATVLTAHDDDVLVTDGPYLEGKEHIGGFLIIEAPDLDAALEWGRKTARVVRLPIEIRPFQDAGAH
jgi:hypothetical protein